MVYQERKKMDGANDDTDDALSVLTRLEEYSAAHEAGAACQAAAQWNLTKARRPRSASGLLPVATLTYQASSLLLQQDLAPQVVLKLEEEEEPALEDEEGVTNTAEKKTKAPRFALIHPAEEREKQKENNPHSMTLQSQTSDDNDTTINSETTTTGLRQRRGKGAATSAAASQPKKTKNVMSEEEAENTATVVDDQDFLQLLAGSLPPRELREAQQAARQALEHYVQAANVLAELLQQTQRTVVRGKEENK